MAKTLEQLSKEAKDTAKELNRLIGAAEGSGDTIEDQFKKFVPVPVIKRNIGEMEKELKEGANTLKDAEALNKEIDKALGGPGTKNPLNKLGKHALALEAAIKKGTKELKLLDGRCDNYQKLLVKVESKQGQDRKEVDLLEDAVKAAKEAEQELGELIIAIPGIADQIEDNFKKKLPASVNKQSIAKLEAELTRLGKKLTTAESIVDSLEGQLKKAEKFEMDEKVRKDHISKGKLASTDLDKRQKSAKTMHQKLLGNMKDYKAQQKQTVG